MTVLYIVDPGIVGGATISFIELVSQMVQKGVKPIVCTSYRNKLNEQLESLGIQTFAIGHAQMLDPVSPYKWKRPIKYPVRWLEYRIKRSLALRKIEHFIDLNEIDLIHTNSARNDIGCFLNKKYGIPHIMHIREFADLDFRCIAYLRDYPHLYNKYVTKFIAISDAIKKHWIKKGLQENKFTTIYNGINYKDIVISNDEDKRNSCLKMVITGGICEAERQLVAVKAFQMLSSEIKDKLSLDIIGWYDPIYMKALQHFVSNNGLEDKIHFLGASKEVHRLLGMYQIGLMCSKAEGFGRVTAEYMHAKLGVIASNAGANPELIQNEKNGLLFDSGDPSSLADCITRFVNDRQFLITCSTNAKVFAEQKFTAEKNADTIMNLYQYIINA